MATGADIFGYIAGIISLLALVGGVLRTFLPSVRMRVLDEILEDTEKILRSAVEEGFFRERVFVLKAQRRLSTLRKECSNLRVRTACATSPLKEYQELCRGLSSSIGYCTGQAKDLHAMVVSESEAERWRLYNEHEALRMDPTSLDRSSVSTLRNARVAASLIVRPASCPPTIQTNISPPSHSVNDGKSPSSCEDSTYSPWNVFARTDTSITDLVYKDWIRSSAFEAIDTGCRLVREGSPGAISQCIHFQSSLTLNQPG